MFFSPLFLSFLVPFSAAICSVSLHDALPIYLAAPGGSQPVTARADQDRGPSRPRGQRPPRPGHLLPPQRLGDRRLHLPRRDRKSTRLNSSHVAISYAVFCLKKKKVIQSTIIT